MADRRSNGSSIRPVATMQRGIACSSSPIRRRGEGCRSGRRDQDERPAAPRSHQSRSRSRTPRRRHLRGDGRPARTEIGATADIDQSRVARPVGGCWPRQSLCRRGPVVVGDRSAPRRRLLAAQRGARGRIGHAASPADHASAGREHDGHARPVRPSGARDVPAGRWGTRARRRRWAHDGLVRATSVLTGSQPGTIAAL